MVSSDQIITNLEQPLCVVRHLDQVILYKNRAFSNVFWNSSNLKFDEIFKMFSDKQIFNNLSEMMSTSRPLFVQYIQDEENRHAPPGRSPYCYQVFVSNYNYTNFTVLFIASEIGVLPKCSRNSHDICDHNEFEKSRLSASSFLSFDERAYRSILGNALDDNIKHNFENLCLDPQIQDGNEHKELENELNFKAKNPLYLTNTCATPVDGYNQDLLKEEMLTNILNKAIETSKEQLIREILHEVKTPFQILSKIRFFVSNTRNSKTVDITNDTDNGMHQKAEIDKEDIDRLHSAVFSICGTLTDISVVSNSLEILQDKDYTVSSFMKFAKSIVHRKLIANLRAGQNLNCHISIDSTISESLLDNSCIGSDFVSSSTSRCSDIETDLKPITACAPMSAISGFTIEGNNLFERILAHMVKNAIQHSPDDSDIYIDVTIKDANKDIIINNNNNIIFRSSELFFQEPVHADNLSDQSLPVTPSSLMKPEFMLCLAVSNQATNDNKFIKTGFEKIKRYMTDGDSFNYNTSVVKPQEMTFNEKDSKDITSCRSTFLKALSVDLDDDFTYNSNDKYSNENDNDNSNEMTTTSRSYNGGGNSNDGIDAIKRSRSMSSLHYDEQNRSNHLKQSLSSNKETGLGLQVITKATKCLNGRVTCQITPVVDTDTHDIHNNSYTNEPNLSAFCHPQSFDPIYISAANNSHNSYISSSTVQQESKSIVRFVVEIPLINVRVVSSTKTVSNQYIGVSSALHHHNHPETHDIDYSSTIDAVEDNDINIQTPHKAAVNKYRMEDVIALSAEDSTLISVKPLSWVEHSDRNGHHNCSNAPFHSPTKLSLNQLHEEFIDSENNQEETSSEEGKPPRQSLHILIVEDTLTIQKLLKRGLERLGHTTCCANNGLAAVNMMNAFKPCQQINSSYTPDNESLESQSRDSVNPPPNRVFDVILIDLRMPVMDGITATTEIRKMTHLDHSKLYIAALSADATIVSKTAALQAGANAFMTKPQRVESVDEHLQNMLQAKQKTI